jgi:IPT/TIG domain
MRRSALHGRRQHFIGAKTRAAGLALLASVGLIVAATAGLSFLPSSIAGASTTWSKTTELSGAPGGSGLLAAVSCANATNCTAVGGDFQNTEQPFYVNETNGIWGTPTQLSTDPNSGFNGVSCTGATNCTAVGTYFNSSNKGQPIYATETNGTWSTVTVMPPSDSLGGDARFEAVSCTNASNCTAVGADGNERPVYATEKNGTWGAVTQLSYTSDSGFNSVSCADALDCTAVGYGNGGNSPIYATETNGTWGTAAALSGTPGGEGTLYGVSCTSAANCTAVGSAGTQLIYATESGGTWGTPTEISDGSYEEGVLEGVSCVDATDCTAVGWNTTDPNNAKLQPIYVTEAGGSWGGPTDLTFPGYSYFASVSCVEATNCTAVGSGGNGNTEPIYASSRLAEVPTVSAVSPGTGPVAGGTSVTITGTGFIGTTKVVFGSTSATSYAVVSDTEITTVSPAQATAGTHGIYVVTPSGTSAHVAADNFTYVGTPPTVTSISPTSGPPTGGTKVTITGTNLSGATKVVFGSVASTSFTVVSSTDIVAVSPAQAAGAHNVNVTTPGGGSAAVAGDVFTYAAPPPTVTSISPTSGPPAGGTKVTITGTNLSGATKVVFGSVASTSFTVVSSTDIVAVSPAQAAGAHNVRVSTPGGGTSAAVAGDVFTYT